VHKLGAALVTVVLALLVAGCGAPGTKTVTETSTATDSTGPSPATPITTLSSSGSGTTTTAPTTSTTSTTTSTAPARANVVHIATFKSPSGNIGCMIIAGTARCDIVKRAWSPPARPHDCPKIVDFGQGLIVTRSGKVGFVCAGDTSRDPSARSLAYNTDTVVDVFRCQSRTNGMTCTNTGDGHGFFIAIQGYRIF